MNGPIVSGQLRRHQRRIDLILAVALGAAGILLTAPFADQWAADDRTVDAWALALVGVAFGALAFRRRWPLVTLGVTTASVSAYLIATYPYGPILIAFFIAVYTVAALLPLRIAALSVALALPVLLIHVFVHPSSLGGLLGLIPGSAWAVVPFAIGTTVRTSRQAKEAARAEAIRDQLYEERIRLAQEVHDIVGHGLAAIQMQADVALHVEEQQPPKTKSALESISRASSEAFEELRSTLDLISESPAATLAPAASLENIEELCHRIGRTGVTVDFDLVGDTESVPSTVGVAVYRIVQEALTNVMRHGAVPAARARVVIGDGEVDIQVSNPGPAEVTSSGHGIAGMERRVAALGGTFDTRATADGFVVEASIPMGGPR
jgi:signal transduction histidine kinase